MDRKPHDVRLHVRARVPSSRPNSHACSPARLSSAQHHHGWHMELGQALEARRNRPPKVTRTGPVAKLRWPAEAVRMYEVPCQGCLLTPTNEGQSYHKAGQNSLRPEPLRVCPPE